MSNSIDLKQEDERAVDIWHWYFAEENSTDTQRRDMKGIWCKESEPGAKTCRQQFIRIYNHPVKSASMLVTSPLLFEHAHHICSLSVSSLETRFTKSVSRHSCSDILYSVFYINHNESYNVSTGRWNSKNGIPQTRFFLLNTSQCEDEK